MEAGFKHTVFLCSRRVYATRKPHLAIPTGAAVILITGATGTVGSEVVKRLSAQGVQLRAVTRDPRKAEVNQFPNVHFKAISMMPTQCAGRAPAWTGRSY
jgi:predicted amino acid dehydrogenase